jgi:hypothetical protein
VVNARCGVFNTPAQPHRHSFTTPRIHHTACPHRPRRAVYPLDFTFTCPTEILAFNDAAKDFEKVGAQVVGASIDSAFTHLAWNQTPRE